MRLPQHIPNIKFPTYGWRKKHKASCKKYKPCILKYKALISKYVPYIFHLSKLLKHSFPRKQKSATFPLRFSFVFFRIVTCFLTTKRRALCDNEVLLFLLSGVLPRQSSLSCFQVPWKSIPLPRQALHIRRC